MLLYGETGRSVPHTMGSVHAPETRGAPLSRDAMEIEPAEHTPRERSTIDTHINTIIGCPVYLESMQQLYPSCLGSRLEPYDLRELNDYRRTADRPTDAAKTRMVMIMPHAIASVTIVRVSPRAGVTDTWVQHVSAASPHASPQLHRASAMLTSMRLPADCVVHAILYTDVKGVAVLGLFDLSSVGTKQMRSESPLARHTCMRETVPEQTLELGGRVLLVRYLWVGCEGACLQALTDPRMIPNMSFAVRCIGVLPTHIDNEPFQCKMLPLVLPNASG